MFGIGLSVAVLLDATVVRMMIVPAVMSLLDRRAWYLPSWLDRLIPNLDVPADRGTLASTRTWFHPSPHPPRMFATPAPCARGQFRSVAPGMARVDKT